MCNYNQLSTEQKEILYHFMNDGAKSVGGVNLLLSLLEKIRENKLNALSSKHLKIEDEQTQIQWNKIIFKDKVELLHKLIISAKDEENILKDKTPKEAKKILNLAKTLSPINFIISSKEDSYEDSINFKAFEIIESDMIKLNPVFVAIFFCSIEFTKKVLKYKI